MSNLPSMANLLHWMGIKESDLGPLAGIVHYATYGVLAATALFLIARGRRRRWEPADTEVPRLAEVTAIVIGAVLTVLIFTFLKNDASLPWLAGAAVLAAIYLYRTFRHFQMLGNSFLHEAPAGILKKDNSVITKRIIGDEDHLTPEATVHRGKGVPLKDLVRGCGDNFDRVFDRKRRATLKQQFQDGYFKLVLSFIVTLACAGQLLSVGVATAKLPVSANLPTSGPTTVNENPAASKPSVSNSHAQSVNGNGNHSYQFGNIGNNSKVTVPSPDADPLSDVATADLVQKALDSYRGVNGTRNLSKAKALLDEGVKRGDSGSMAIKGLWLVQGTAYRKDAEEGLHLWEEAATQGEANAALWRGQYQYDVIDGDHWRTGPGFIRYGLHVAIHWYLVADRLGNKEAASLLQKSWPKETIEMLKQDYPDDLLLLEEVLHRNATAK